MKKNILSILASFSLTLGFGQNRLNGTYIGLEEMCSIDSLGKKDCYTDPGNPKWKWYHLSYLKIKDDSAFLDQNPIAIYKKDTSYSVSDGAFYYWKGIITKSDTVIKIDLTEISCDYCGVLSEEQPDGSFKSVKRVKHFLGKLTKKGIVINGSLYKRTDKKQSLRSEHLQVFLGE